ncbi:MAG: DUF6605 domain-containing protein [Bacteroidia bacterium]|nr:DUF6605 domain-containing protein [Bacteroidia bacterium]
MRRRNLLRLSALLLVLAASGAYWAAQQHYLFPNGSQLFAWRHRWTAHLECYTERWSLRPGDPLRVFASSSSPGPARVRVYPAAGGEAVLDMPVQVPYQPLRADASVQGCGWEAVWQGALPAAAPGWYLAELEQQGRRRRSSLFILPAGRPQRRIAWIFSTSTWEAYNAWGGKSLYSRDYTHTVSRLRPQPASDPGIPNTWEHHQLYYQAASRDLPLAQLLDSAGLAFDAYSMNDLDAGDSALLAYDVLLLSTHAEYWSEASLRHLNACLDRGASLVCLAGNVAAWVTHFDPAAQQMTVYKSAPNLWEQADTLGLRPFGTQYIYLGFHTYAPYQVLDSSWLWAGTGLRPGDLFGSRSDMYDYTYMYASPAEALLGLLRKGRAGAASGMEIDKVYPRTPAGWRTLASGLNPPREGRGEVYPDPALPWEAGSGADLGYYPHPGGGIVFNVSSMAFTGAIPYDARIRQIVLNAVRRGLRP